ncbi:hypothetical protein BDW74DRAFT_172384 [Aspergillus multicolor]|uniref:uncharacterized protein n=1 Tax=Aspergillus multicolor TaxID=41759 RepID=UPI003CCE2AD4
MEKLVKADKISGTGVSNFTIEKLEELLGTAEIPPAWLKDKDVFTVAYNCDSRLELEALNKLDRNQRYNYLFRWGVDVFGELGIEEAERRAEERGPKQREAA